MRQRWFVVAGLSIAAILGGAVGAPAQDVAQEGSITGIVTTPDGTQLGGVRVTLGDTGRFQVTNNDGRFRFQGVAPGSYELGFELGENTATQAVEVVAGETAQSDVAVDWDVSFAETITVLGASRQRERVVDAPAAVTVVTEEEIEREAAHGQLPKLLEFTPGAEVTQSGIYDFNLNTRGFNSSLNRRVATLIDGRDPSVPFLGAQEWASMSFPLDDLAAAEFIRGPSAALYGANASSGVLNLTTKQPRYSEGGEVRLTAGELSTVNGDARWAGHLGGEWYGKLVGGFRSHDDFTLSRRGAAEYSIPCTARGQTDCLPQEAVAPLVSDDEIAFGSARVDHYLTAGSFFTLEGGLATIEGPVFQTGIGRVQLVDVERPWARANFSSEHWNVLGYYNGRDASDQLALSAGTNLALDSENYHGEIQGNWGFGGGRGRVVVGGSYSEDDIDSFDPRVRAQTLMFEPVNHDFQAAYGQLDWSVTPQLKVVVAGRYDESSLHDSQFSPKGSVVYGINPNHTLRLTYNEAFQVANYSEFFLQANAAPPVNLSPFEAFCSPFGVSCGFGPGPTRILALGNQDLELEEVETIELGYSGILAGNTFLSVDYYNSENSNFITDLLPQLGTPLGRINPNFGPYQPPSGLPAPVAAALLATLQGALGPNFAILSNNVDGTPILAAASYTNFGDVDTQGVEVGLNVHHGMGWRTSFAYSWFDFEIKRRIQGLEDLLLPNAPEHQASLGVAYVVERWDGAVSYRWVDDFRWVVGPFQGEVDSYGVVDLIGNYHLSDHWTVGANISNLFDEEHWESFGGDLLERRALGSVTFSW